jgi:hypothetical protein
MTKRSSTGSRLGLAIGAYVVAGIAACGGPGASSSDAALPDGQTTAQSDQERCVAAGGVWSDPDQDCTLPHFNPTPFWRELEDQFRLEFDAAVTGSALDPWLELYIDPQPGVVHTCASWQVKAGYASTSNPGTPDNPAYLRSKDCRFEIMQSTCGAQRDRTIVFRIDGWASTAPGTGASLNFRISEWVVLHSLTAKDLQTCP